MPQLVERDFFRPTAIRLSSSARPGPQSHSLQGINPEVQVLRVGRFNHPKYGEFEITPLTLSELKLNFDNKVRGVDLAIDYFHKSDESAAGWIKELYLSEDSQELWARVDWTNEATKKLTEREIRYFSPDFAFQWTDPENGKVFKNVLFGGGLTNRPFVKDMAAIVAHENKGDIMTEDQIKKLEAVLKLAEDGAENMKKMQADQLAMKSHLEKLGAAPAATPPAAAAPAVPPPAAKPKLEEDPDGATDVDADQDSEDPVVLKKQLAEMKKKLAEYAEKDKLHLAEKAKLEEAKQMAEKEASFNILLTEGKACAAQKSAFIKGDMTAFVKLAQPLNLVGKGSASAEGSADDDRDDRVLKLAEEKRRADPKLDVIKSITLANNEIAK